MAEERCGRLKRKPTPLPAVCIDDSRRMFAIAHEVRLGAKSYDLLPYQLSMVMPWITMAFTGNGESGLDSGEGA